MSREILFRGKTLQGGEWVFGDYMRYAGGAQIWVHAPDGGTSNVLVDPATVGQYTGLTDKNGVKIFEGDIVEGYDFDAEDGYGLVRWHAGAFEVFRNDVSGSFLECYLGTGFKVIGNVYDSPDLLYGNP